MVGRMNHDPIPADPGAIDLTEIGQRYLIADLASKLVIVNGLIAAVEALRERVVELEHGWDVWCKTAEQQAEMRKAAEARVVELEGELK